MPESPSVFNTYTALINVFSLALLAIITGWVSSRREKREAERALAASQQVAELRSKEKAEDWARQDVVAEKVAAAALKAEDAAQLLLNQQTESTKRQDVVAEKVATAADQAASAAQLLLASQKDSRQRQDEVAEKVAVAADQAKNAAQLLLDSQRDAKERQDEVAEKVATAASQAANAATLLAAAQEAMKAATIEVARVAAESQKFIADKLNESLEQGRKIHNLVNSDMTAAKEQERDSVRLLVIALKSMQALNIKNGIKPTKEDTDAIAKAEQRVVELNKIIEDRHAAQALSDAEDANMMTEKAKALKADSKTVQAAEVSLREIEKNTAQTAKNTEQNTKGE